METTCNTITSADGTAIAWYEFGGDGPDVLLGHATGFNGSMWQPVVEHLRPYLRCVAYDVRAHGASGRPHGSSDHGFAWERFADDVEAVMHAARMDDAFGIGHSSGGATQLLLEQRRSGSFRSLYLYEPVIFASDPPAGPDPDRELAVRARKRRASFPTRDAAMENFIAKGPFTRLDRRALELYVDTAFTHTDSGLELRCRPDDEADIYVMASAHTGYVDLPAVQCPVVVAHGGTSLSFSSKDMNAVVERLPVARLEEFPDLGHFGPLEQPRMFADAVLRAFGLDVSAVG